MRVALLAFALVALAAVSVAAQSSTGGAGPVATSICERITQGQKMDFTNSADQYKSVAILMVRTATGINTTNSALGLFRNTDTLPYFNGEIKYRNSSAVTPSPFAKALQPGDRTPDFTSAVDATSLNTLVDHLVKFFGPSLGCKIGTGYPQYDSTYTGFGAFTQYQVHANMQINQRVFSAFNNAVINAAGSMGATSADADAVMGVLNSFARNNVAGQNANMICTQSDCVCATGVTGDNCDNENSVAATSASFVTLAAAALVALFAMRR